MDNVILIFGALIGSFVSGVAGMGGGALLIGIMAIVMPTSILIPSHGLVQLGSTLSRTALHFRELDRKIAFKYICGAIVGALIGINLKFDLSEKFLGLCLGSFILFSVWFPMQKLQKFKLLANYVVIGFTSTILALFVGVAGPLVHPFILNEKHLSRFGFIGTESICAASSHFLKIIVFSAWGVSILPYWKVLTAMVLVTIVGAYLGKLVVRKVKDHHYKLAIRILISLLSLRIIVSSL